ncbi:hypothetical protein N9059_01675, partial [bacterium]|nr:hypothetical protein [bacterium]
GVKEGCVPEAALCAALVSGRNILMRVDRGDSRQKEQRADLMEGAISDLQVLMRAFLMVREQRFNMDVCRRLGVHGQTARTVEMTMQQLLTICVKQKLVDKDDFRVDPDRGEAICRAALTGFVDQLGVRKDKGSLDCLVHGGRKGTLARESAMAREGAPSMFVIGEMREIDSKMRSNLTLISMASGVKREWLEELFPTQMKRQRVYEYDSHHKRIQGWDVVGLAGFELERIKTPELDEIESGRALARAFIKGEAHLPNWNHEVQQLVARSRLMAAVDRDLGFPKFTDEELIDCIGAGLKGLSVLKRAQEIPLMGVVRKVLGKDLMEWLDEMMPRSVDLGDAGKRKLLYALEVSEDKDALVGPELQIKINECFPIREHPCVADGKLPLLFRLQRPNGKKLTETTDWPEFRRKDYPKLKAELSKKFGNIVWV